MSHYKCQLYLLLPNCQTAGVKQREGWLEVKMPVVGSRSFAQDGIAGRGAAAETLIM
jgi:hypothetical protein